LKRAHYSEYDEETTARCERALVTVLGNVGLWRERVYLAGGLAPRYLVGQLPEGAREHVDAARARTQAPGAPYQRNRARLILVILPISVTTYSCSNPAKAPIKLAE